MNEYSVLVLQPWMSHRGAETLSYQIVEDLNASGVAARLSCLFVRGDVDVASDLLLMPRRWMQQIVKNSYGFLFFGFLFNLWLVLSNGSYYTILNPHNFPTVWIAVITKMFFKNKVVWTVHNFPQHPFRGKTALFFEFLISPIDRWFVSRVDDIVCVSKKVQREVEQKYGVDSRVIYPGMDFDFWSRYAKTPFLSCHENTQILLHVGQIRPEKRQFFSYRVYSELRKSNVDARLVLVGECPESFIKYADEIKNSPYSEGVVWVGSIPKKDLAGLYHQANVVICPSSWGEGCTLVPLEAILAQCGIVALVEGCGSDELIDGDPLSIVFPVESIPEFVSKKIIEYSRCATRREHSVSIPNRIEYCLQYRHIFESIV